MADEKNFKENMAPKENGHELTPQSNNLENEDAIDPQAALEEIDTVNSNLDSMNSILDSMEEKADEIKAQLLQLLESNRKIRESIKQENDGTSNQQATN